MAEAILDLPTLQDSVSLLQVQPGNLYQQQDVGGKGKRTAEIVFATGEIQQAREEHRGHTKTGVATTTCPQFIHIAKNAGGTIETSGLAAGVIWGCALMSEDLPMRGGSTCSACHVPPYLLAPELATAYSEETFCVSRNPYDRFISGFKHHCGSDCSVDDLNTFIQSKLQPRFNAFFKACHFTPQTYYIWAPNGEKICDNILRMEQLDHDFQWLMASTGCKVQLLDDDEIQSNSSHFGSHAVDANLSVSDLTSTSIALVNQIYHDDFVKLGYDFVDP